MLTNSDIWNKYTVTVRYKFGTLQETLEKYTPSDEHENFVTTHIEAAGEYIPVKSRAMGVNCC